MMQKLVDRTAVGNRLRKLRRSLGYEDRQREFAEECLGVAWRTYQSYERGEALPSFEFLQKMAASTNCNLNWILMAKPPMFAENDPDLEMLLSNSGQFSTEDLVKIQIDVATQLAERVKRSNGVLN